MTELTPYQWQIILITTAVIVGFFWAIIALSRADHRAKRKRLHKYDLAALHSFDDKDGWIMTWDTMRRLSEDGLIHTKLTRTQKGLAKVNPE